MKICVLGAGVIGVSTAYMLGRLGHEVIVIDQHDDIAAGTSHANGAQLSYSYIDPFAAPATLKSLPAYLLGLDPAIKFGWSLNPSYLHWGINFLRNCAPGRHETNFLQRSEIAQLSQELKSEIDMEVEPDSLKATGYGKIVLANNQAKLDELKRSIIYKNEKGFSLRALDAGECIEREPALKSWKGNFIGGVYSDNDRALDTQMFCKVMKKVSKYKFNVKYRMGEKVTRLESNNGQITAVATDEEVIACDVVVSCLGADSNAFLKRYGIKLPIYPIQGYSLTLPVTGNSLTCSITDIKHKIVFARLKNHIRIAGFMDANLNPNRRQARCKYLLHLAETLWPNIANYNADPNFWFGFRPMTPSGVPIIEETKIKGLYLNTGHGSLGYTFALGSAKKISDIIGHAQTNHIVRSGSVL